MRDLCRCCAAAAAATAAAAAAAAAEEGEVRNVRWGEGGAAARWKISYVAGAVNATVATSGGCDAHAPLQRGACRCRASPAHPQTFLKHSSIIPRPGRTSPECNHRSILLGTLFLPPVRDRLGIKAELMPVLCIQNCKKRANGTEFVIKRCG